MFRWQATYCGFADNSAKKNDSTGWPVSVFFSMQRQKWGDFVIHVLAQKQTGKKWSSQGGCLGRRNVTLAGDWGSSLTNSQCILQKMTVTKKITKALWNWVLSVSFFYYIQYGGQGPLTTFFLASKKLLASCRACFRKDLHQFYDLGSWE